MVEYDPGPPPDVADHLDRVPSYAAHQDLFWYDWGPVLYRGRLDRSARLLCIASDPGPTERIAARTLVGDAGQRVQGFLSKLGLTRSYACVNAHAYALLPSRSMSAIPILSEPEQQSWRNELLSVIVGPELQAVVTFGLQARIAVELWSNAPPVMIKRCRTHPAGTRRSSSPSGVQQWLICARWSLRIRRETIPGPTTAADSPRVITRLFRAVICRTEFPAGWATIPGAANPVRNAATRSNETRLTSCTH